MNGHTIERVPADMAGASERSGVALPSHIFSSFVLNWMFATSATADSFCAARSRSTSVSNCNSYHLCRPAARVRSSLRVSTGNRRFRELTFSSESISSTETIPARVATDRVLAAASAACSRLPMAASSK